MNTEKLKSLETNSNVIEKYAGASAFGKNRLIYLPLLLGIFLIIFIAMAFLSDLTETIGMMALVLMGAGALLCFVVVAMMASAAKKKMIAETTFAPTCIAKKLVGNQREEAYLCIYTTDGQRHSSEFLDEIAEKIGSAIEAPQNAIDKQVANLFREDFIKPNEFAKQLPLVFTDNVVVWRKQISFVGTPDHIKQKIEDENGNFAMVALVQENARFLFEYYT